MKMTSQQVAAIYQLRESGCAVVIVPPEELGPICRHRLENCLHTDATEHIDELRSQLAQVVAYA